MNLLLDPWIPLRRQSGAVEVAAPWQITEAIEGNPFIGFGSVRPDFDGALAQFLIGLLQTAFAPEHPRDWRLRFDSPPAAAALLEAFQPLAFAFELFGEGPRFLQDLTLEADEPAEEAIERLLIEAPGKNTVALGRDHFVKGGRIEALCPVCAATALLTLQINAPKGGQGHRTGLRGGGPLTTLIAHHESLWKTLWLNVLLPSRFAGDGEGRNRLEESFPWLAPTRTSGKHDGRDTTFSDVHPFQVFWAMPRRIRLRPGPTTEVDGAACSLCASHARPLVRTFLKRNLGVNYAGPWNHPLTPYRQTDGGFLPCHGSPSGLSYRNWVGLVANDPDRRIRPAAVVEALYLEDDRRTRAENILWAFGYDMDDMKARAWLDGLMPLLIVSPESREAFELEAMRLVRVASAAGQQLVAAAKEAVTAWPLAHDPADVEIRFWQETEAPFYEHLRRVRELVEAGKDTEVARLSWLRELRRRASRALESVTTVGSFDATDPRRVANAWNRLQRFFQSAKMRDLLGLPVAEKKAAKRRSSRFDAPTGGEE
jgi:CRISPR system Cascade subunit CasA